MRQAAQFLGRGRALAQVEQQPAPVLQDKVNRLYSVHYT